MIFGMIFGTRRRTVVPRPAFNLVAVAFILAPHIFSASVAVRGATDADAVLSPAAAFVDDANEYPNACFLALCARVDVFRVAHSFAALRCPCAQATRSAAGSTRRGIFGASSREAGAEAAVAYPSRGGSAVRVSPAANPRARRSRLAAAAAAGISTEHHRRLGRRLARRRRTSSRPRPSASLAAFGGCLAPS